jgi:ABC-type glycerol-3-phosphate transport system substrate-binding protein
VEEVQALLGPGEASAGSGGQTLRWPAGIKNVYVSFVDGRVSSKEARLLPARQRQQYCQWGAAAFPSAVPGLNNVTYAGMDVWIVPRTSRHKKEAFEFLAFASRQAQIEKLSSLHCNLSPLAQESEEYLRDHPNPYVDVYEALAASPNARPVPPLINWPQISDELTQVSERSYLLQGTTAQILETAQERGQRELNKALNVSENTIPDAKSGNAQ